MTEPIVIHIQPAGEGMIDYDIYMGGFFLLGPTPKPYITAARELIADGYDPARKLIMRRRGVDVNQLSYALGDAARLTVENQANPPFLWPLQQDGPGAVP